MNRVVNEETGTSREKHTCCFCLNTIWENTKVVTQTVSDDFSTWISRSHESCWSLRPGYLAERRMDPADQGQKGTVSDVEAFRAYKSRRFKESMYLQGPKLIREEPIDLPYPTET